jgi:hypothetical protein
VLSITIADSLISHTKGTSLGGVQATGIIFKKSFFKEDFISIFLF